VGHVVYDLRIDDDEGLMVRLLEDAPTELRVGMGTRVLSLIDEPFAVVVEDETVLVTVDTGNSKPSIRVIPPSTSGEVASMIAM